MKEQNGDDDSGKSNNIDIMTSGGGQERINGDDDEDIAEPVLDTSNGPIIMGYANFHSSTDTLVTIQSPLLEPNHGNRTALWEKLRTYRESKSAVIAVIALALFVDMVLYDVIVPILPTLLKSVGKDESYVGMLFAIYAVGFLVATPIFGIWSDRIQDRKIPMILGQAGLAIATIMFAFARTFWLLVTARLVQGVAAAISWTLGLALLADAVPGNELGSAMGIVFGFQTLGYFVGPLMGGVLTQAVSIETPFLICAGLCIIDLLARAMIRPQKPMSPQSNSQGITLVKLLGYPEIIVVGLVSVFTSCSFSAVETLLSAYLQATFGLDVMHVSFAMMAIIIPSVIFSFLGGWWADRFCRYKMILIAMSLYVFATPLLGLVEPLWLFLLVSAYFGATSSIIQAPVLPEMGSIVTRLGEGSYAQVYAILNVFYSSGMLVGPLVASALNERFNFLVAMSFFSAPFLMLMPLVAWMVYRSNRKTLRSMKFPNEPAAVTFGDKP